MPILKKGIHVCEKCKREFEWVHFELIKNKLSSNKFQVEIIPKEPKIHRVEYMDTGELKAYINCPHCDFYNSFIIELND